MMSAWRRRRRSSSGKKQELLVEDNGKEAGSKELAIPSHFRCPISLDLMKDPVTLSTGISYDRESIETWIENGSRSCPITKQALVSLEPIPNHTLRKMIQSWCVENSCYGVERISTPRIPLTASEASNMLVKIESARARKDRAGCGELVAKMSLRMKESERSRKCLEENGAGKVLGATFETFASDIAACFDQNKSILADILAALGSMFPLDDAARFSLGSPASMHCLVGLLSQGDLSTTRNAIMALRDIASSDEVRLERFVKVEGSIQACYKLLEKPICLASAKASLMLVFRIVSSPAKFEATVSNLVQMGLVSLLLDTLVGSDRSMSEKALGVLDAVCDTQPGAQHAYDNVLTMPVLVKKILRVSDLATDFSVSVMWKLTKNDKEGRVLIEALQVGAFQKLLLLLQVGCGEKTKEKATELLKKLNVYRERLECIDSMDFKNLKRSI
uniref:U-box domain-containing protein n=1 Tax=Kalanchoe fedtschenkoi TaxID=63787 RepID=A0A7N0TGU3_KALFE